MNPIVCWFLRAKHWQIFVGFVLLFVIGNIALISSKLSDPSSLLTFGWRSLLFLAVWLLCFGYFLIWFWSMGSFLNSRLKPERRLRTDFFRFSIIYPALYAILFMTAFTSSNPSVALVILPLHFFAMFCMFYDLYFVAKILVLVETGKPASFYDYAGPFFLLWFFPIGVWLTQPRINRLYEESAERLS